MYMYRRRNFYTSVTRYLLFELFFNVSIHFKQKMGVVAPSRISDILTKCKKCIIQKLSHLKHTWGTKRCGSVWLFIRHLDILHFEVFFQYWWHFMNLICILYHFVIFLPRCLGPFAMYASSGAVKGRSWEVMLMPRSPMLGGPLTKAMTGIHTSWVAFGKKPGANMRLRFLQAFDYAREMCNQAVCWGSQISQRTKHWYTPVLVNENTCQGPCCLLFCSPAQWVGFCPAKAPYSRLSRGVQRAWNTFMLFDLNLLKSNQTNPKTKQQSRKEINQVRTHWNLFSQKRIWCKIAKAL